MRLYFSCFSATEDGFVRAHSPSPARHPPSNIVHVRGLTRPFTLPQLHELLAKFGSFNKDEFWIDNIKSHCIVKVRTSVTSFRMLTNCNLSVYLQYSDESEAIRARERLHNIHWPITNTKFLRVDFATQEDVRPFCGRNFLAFRLLFAYSWIVIEAKIRRLEN